MYEFTITKNANADIGYFDIWMREHYPSKYEGFSDSSEWAYIKIMSDEEFTAGEKSGISSAYAALTLDETIDLKHCRINKFLDDHTVMGEPTQPPFQVDYVRELGERLHSLVTEIYKGEVREITYYESVIQNQDGTLTGVNPVVRENYVYTRDVAKMVISRVLTITWINEDGTGNYLQKTRQKYYSPEEKIVEGQRLRRNIIDFCQPNVLGMIMATEQVDYDTAVTLGAQLSNKYSSEMSSWITSSRGNPLIQIVTDDTEILWLNNVTDAQGTTIRDYILDQLNY